MYGGAHFFLIAYDGCILQLQAVEFSTSLVTIDEPFQLFSRFYKKKLTNPLSIKNNTITLRGNIIIQDNKIIKNKN